MASCTKVRKVRTALKAKKRGRIRKNKLAKQGTTPSKTEFFSAKSA